MRGEVAMNNQEILDGVSTTKKSKQSEYVMYIVVNSELGMSTGKIAAQVGHVIVNYMLQNEYINPDWINNGQPKIVLGADQKTMEELLQFPDTYYIYDGGRTEVPRNSLTALCFAPMLRKEAPKEIRRLRLFTQN